MITSFGGLDLPGQCNSPWETCRKCDNGPSVEHCRWHLSGAVPACYPPVYPYFALITLPGTVSAGQYCQYRQYSPAFRHAKNFSAPGNPHSPLKVPYGIRTALQAGPAGKEQPEYLLRFRQMLTATSLASIRLGMQWYAGSDPVTRKQTASW